METITDEIIAQNQVERFVSRFESTYRLLAYHAALPLVLTPELVNYIRVQFLKSEGVPWIAEADLLLSDLCRPVGYELYVMDEAVRAYLLQELETDPRFGEQRIREIARLLLNYVKYLAKTNPFLGDLQTQQWGAMLYLDTEQTVREIAHAIAEAVNKAEIARLLKITEDFKNQIAKSHWSEKFLEYAKVVNDLIRKPETVKQEAITGTYQIAGSELSVPKILVNSLIKTFKVVTIEIIETHTFDFTIATIEPQSGKIINRQQSQAEGIIEVIGTGIELELIKIPPGTFIMGAPEEESGSKDNERPQHQVRVPSFYMGRYPITQAQWQAVAALPQIKGKLNPNPSSFKGANRPVERVSWDDAVEFCSRLSNHTKRDYRLPSEAEWEYACRAGTTTPFHFGETITTDVANYDGKSTYGNGPKGVYRGETTEVGSFGVANNFGLYDMHGNVREWCQDEWHDSYEGAPMDGSAWQSANASSDGRMLRGGSWADHPVICRSAYRYGSFADFSNDFYGFRVACAAAWTL